MSFWPLDTARSRRAASVGVARFSASLRTRDSEGCAASTSCRFPQSLFTFIYVFGTDGGGSLACLPLSSRKWRRGLFSVSPAICLTEAEQKKIVSAIGIGRNANTAAECRVIFTPHARLFSLLLVGVSLLS